MGQDRPRANASSEAARLIATLELSPHPEGGWFRRIHTGSVPVQRGDGAERPGLTVIHYLLEEGDRSAWHQVASDEVWHHAGGSPIRLLQRAPDSPVRETRLGPLPTDRPVAVVPAGHWQAAVCDGPWCLATCAVGPGFDFADFRLLRDTPPVPEWATVPGVPDLL